MAAEPERARELAREEVDLFLDCRGAPRVVKAGQLRELAVELVEARLVCGSGARVGQASDLAPPPGRATHGGVGYSVTAARPTAADAVSASIFVARRVRPSADVVAVADARSTRAR